MTKITLLNTRPRPLIKATQIEFENMGFKVINFPCIDILAVDDTYKVKQQLNNISAVDTLIFTSQHAVKFAYDINKNLKFTDTNTIITVGKKTAELLEHKCQCHIWTPEKQNSQGVIDLLKGMSHTNPIQLITATHGLDKIQKFAKDSGVQLNQINVYQRKLAAVESKSLEKITKSQQLLILATSSNTLINLKKIVTSKIWKELLTKKIVCASKRIEINAKKLGFKNTLNTHSANPNTIGKYLKKHRIN